MLALIGGLIAAGAGLIGSGMQADAAKRAGQAGEHAMKNAMRSREGMFNRISGQLAPWRETGKQALGEFSNLAGRADISDFDFQSDPGYQFRLDEGTKALEASAAARGGYFSGGTGMDLTRYGQGMASQEYGNAFDRWRRMEDTNASQLYNLANMGLGASGQTGAMGTTAASGVAQDMATSGSLQAQGIQGQANAWSGGLRNLSNQVMGGIGAYKQNQLLRSLGN